MKHPLSKLPEDFDAESYLFLNPDVKESGLPASKHYLDHGFREGRKYKKCDRALLPLLPTPYDSDGLRTVHNHDFMMQSEFATAYERGVLAAGEDYKWYWRVHIGLWAARSAARVSGDFVECGVNRGFLSSAIMKDLDWNDTGRTFYLLDTFSGLDERFVSAREKQGGVLNRNRDQIESRFYTTNLESVRSNFQEWKNVEIVAGSIPETLSRISSDSIAFLHIDMNCTLPEVAVIDALWDKMEKGGIVLLDDYAYHGYQPQKEGMDAWASPKGVPIASLPTGQGLIIKV